MGGQAAGKVASALTIQSIIEWMALARPIAGMPAGERLTRAFAFAHDRVSSRGLKDYRCTGMGSTAIAGLLDGNRLHICHVGVARAYIWSSGAFRRITDDHSWVWENLVKCGSLTPEETRSHPQRAQVTQALGTGPVVTPGLTEVMLKPGERLLLCSDGLWKGVSDEEIQAALASDGSMWELASALVDRANSAGGEDNITVILYEHTGQASVRFATTGLKGGPQNGRSNRQL
jgi:protein phosphatase